MAPSARRLPGGWTGRGVPGPARARAAMRGAGDPRRGTGRDRSRRRLPEGTWRGCPPRKQGRDPVRTGRRGPSGALPPGRLAASQPDGGKLVPGRLGSSPCSQRMGHLPSGASPGGSHLRDGSRSSGRTERWGREAGTKVEGEALEAPAWVRRSRHRARPVRQSSGCARRGRKLSDLVGKTPKQTAVRSRCPPVSALAPPSASLPPAPAAAHDLGRPLADRLRGSGARGRQHESCLPSRHHHRLSLPCQRRPP
jgi:hypothetical protein